MDNGEEALKQAQEEADKAIALAEVENIISNNEICFEYEGKKYKVVKPTTEQKTVAYKKKVAKYMELLKEKGDNGDYIYLPEKKLKEVYKDRGIDIDGLDIKIKNLGETLTKKQEKLGKLLTETDDLKVLNILKDEIEDIKKDIYETSFYKNNLLEYSIENQSNGYFYEYLTYEMTFVQNEKNEYVRAFKDYNDFKKSDASLTNKLGFYVGVLLGNI